MSVEHFIPFRKKDVLAMCADDLPADERDDFRTFNEILASLLHHRFRDRIESIEDAYFLFNPAADVRAIRAADPADRAEAQRTLERELIALATDANFTQVSDDELSAAFDEHSLLKVRMEVDRHAIEKAMFFRRGESTRTAEVKSWFGLRRKTIEYTSYGKVLVFVTFKSADELPDDDPAEIPFVPGSTIVKLFEDVPRNDMEMLFPNVAPRMRLIDKLMIGVPAAVSGVIIIVTKLIAAIGLLLLLGAFWLGLRDESVRIDQTALVSVGVGLAAFGSFVMRQVNKFKNRKIKFMKVLSENLYHRNLDNDAGVFHRLLGAAEDSEVKEAVLAYHFLRTAERPLTADELDERIESWFAQRWNERFDFEVDDGVSKLRDLSLVAEDDDGRLSAVTLPEAKRRIDHVWDNLFNYNDRLVG